MSDNKLLAQSGEAHRDVSSGEIFRWGKYCKGSVGRISITIFAYSDNDADIDQCREQDKSNVAVLDREIVLALRLMLPNDTHRLTNSWEKAFRQRKGRPSRNSATRSMAEGVEVALLT